MEHLKLVICYHCQALADHLKPDCPLLSEAQVCAKCSQRGHYSRDCPNNAYCIRCGGNHPAFARICPIYKQKFLATFIEAKEQSSHTHPQSINDLPPASPLNVPDSWVTLSDAVTAALSSTDTPRDFLISMFSNLKASPPPSYHNIDPFKYNIDEWSQSSLRSLSLERAPSILSVDDLPPQQVPQAKQSSLRSLSLGRAPSVLSLDVPCPQQESQNKQNPLVQDEPLATRDAAVKPTATGTDVNVNAHVTLVPTCLIEPQDKIAATNAADSIQSSPSWTEQSNRNNKKSRKRMNKKQKTPSTNSPTISKNHTGEKPTISKNHTGENPYLQNKSEKPQADTEEYILPADELVWTNFFNALRSRLVSRELSDQESFVALDLIHYQNVISYLPLTEQVTIFQQLCLLTNTAIETAD